MKVKNSKLKENNYQLLVFNFQLYKEADIDV